MHKNCIECNLIEKCNGVVVGVGPLEAEIVIVGESPGREEDKEGIPFVGDTGKLLDYMLDQAGIIRELCFVTNAIKCLPGGTNLTNFYVELCRPFLFKELSLLKDPKVIIAFGNIATESLIERQEITEINGFWHDWKGIPVLSLLHPAHTLRNLFELDLQIRYLKKIWRVVKRHDS